MKTVLIFLVLAVTLFVFQASALDCSYYIEQACWYGNTKSELKQKRCERDALPLCNDGKACEACKRACHDGDNETACFVLYCLDSFLCP
jgi:hypothetical protein